MHILINQFVTAKLMGVEDCRQGICIVQTPEFIKVLGETGTIYDCEARATIVPHKNLFGSTKEFVDDFLAAQAWDSAASS